MAHSGQSSYSGYFIRLPERDMRGRKRIGLESKKELAQRRTSMYQNQPASDEPSAYGAAFRNDNVAASEARHKARAAENISKIMNQYGGK
ncbi:hypothetical protein CSAL01_04330 [Colletotrichum salicis]|uniref:Uncharacterized protein n=1 Tax=Colletotrichum salicis TaxID=1209931 RepID=A0A135UA90_9PEZI|nr:hypothetical protein CSAL01_04330 [Colletotrichum salicis]